MTTNDQEKTIAKLLAYTKDAVAAIEEVNQDNHYVLHVGLHAVIESVALLGTDTPGLAPAEEVSRTARRLVVQTRDRHGDWSRTNMAARALSHLVEGVGFLRQEGFTHRVDLLTDGAADLLSLTGGERAERYAWKPKQPEFNLPNVA